MLRPEQKAHPPAYSITVDAKNLPDPARQNGFWLSQGEAYWDGNVVIPHGLTCRQLREEDKIHLPCLWEIPAGTPICVRHFADRIVISVGERIS
jgi:hypothetical protein